jgi:histidinol-phosphate aminotransferase
LDKNENNDQFLKKVHKSILKKIKLNDITAYPDLTDTYKQVSKFLKLNKKKIYLTSGSDLAIKAIFETLVLPKDKVLITNPTYAMYGIYCELFNAKKILINYKFSTKQPFLEVNEIISAIKKHKPKLICIPNPDSPTGQVVSNRNLKKIINLAKKNRGFVLIDEAYYLFYKKSLISSINQFSNLIITRSASKAIGIAGLRVGIVISNTSLISKIFMHKPMYEISSVASLFIKEIVKPKNYKLIKNSVNRLLDGKRTFISYLKKKNLKYLYSYGNFIHVNFGKLKSRITTRLQKYIYFRLDESHNSLKGYSRISLTTKKNFKSIIKIIEDCY